MSKTDFYITYPYMYICIYPYMSTIDELFSAVQNVLIHIM